jgi:hypothetical protein
MTLPRADRRSTAAERKVNRLRFQAIKAQVAASPEALALRETKRGDAARGRAQKKLRRILAGLRDDARPFSGAELAKLKPEELIRLQQLSSRRYAALDPEQRRRLSVNLALILVCVSDEKYRAIADFDPPAAG